LVSTLDLYDLLLHGDTSGDKTVASGDVIFIPPIGNIVSVDGAVQRPAIYELKSEKTGAGHRRCRRFEAGCRRETRAAGKNSTVPIAPNAQHRFDCRRKPRD